MYTSNDENIKTKKRMKRKIRINHSRSPIILVKNKIRNKKQKPIDMQETLDNLEQVMQRVQNIIDQDEREDNKDKLLKMIYDQDINAESVQKTIGLTDLELESIVDELVQSGFLKYINENEVEITNHGILYLQNL